MKPLHAAVLMASAALTLSACKTLDGLVDDVDSLNLPSALPSYESSADGLTYTGNCPRVEVVPELKIYSDFTDDSTTRPEALVSRAVISNIQTACEFDTRTVTLDLKATFQGTLGPRGRTSASDKPFFSYPFFVAVAESGGHVLSKEIYAATITYPPGKNVHSYNENMRFILPMETRDQGRNQKILLGFQLTPDQLTYNRKLIKAEKARAEREAKAAQKAKETAKKSGTPAPANAPQNLTIQSEPLKAPSWRN